MSTLTELLKTQKDLELEHVETLKPTLKFTSNAFVHTLLESMIYDSQKHAIFCDFLMKLGPGQSGSEIEEVEAVELSEAIEEHLKVEAEMITNLETIREKIKDEKARNILDYMLSDEHRHHNTLKGIADLVNQAKDHSEDRLDLFEKYMYPGPDHGHKTYKL